MTGDLIAAVDLSTTGSKCVIWDAAGTAIATGRAELDLATPFPGAGEQNPIQWWTATVQAVSTAVAQVDAARVRGIAVANQRETFACLDEAGDPVRPAMLWLDRRASAEVEQHGSDRVHDLTGKPVNPTPAYYKLHWLRANEPQTLDRTAHVVDVHGFLVQRMTGRWVTSVAAADPLGLVDVRTGDWDDGLLSEVGLSRSQVGDLVLPGDVVAPLSETAGAQLGLPAGLPVVSGAGDGQTAALGANVTRPGRAWLNLGTGLVAGCYSDEYRARTDYRAMTGAVPGTWSFEIFIGAGTYMVTWFLETFLTPAERTPIDGVTIEQRLADEAAHVPIGADGLLVVPYWNAALTPYWDQDARGVVIGLHGGHGRAHIYRAVLEGLAYELRLCLERIDAALPVPVAELVTMGGGARSDLWCQLIADVLHKPLVLSGHEETTCLGAAILAAAGSGMHPDIRSAASAMATTRRRFEPNPTDSERYDRLYEVYAQVYPANRALFRPLTEAAR